MTSPEQVSVRLTRDSVCAGDDVFAPNEKWVKIPVSGFTEELVRQIVHLRYLASIRGGRAAWVLWIDDLPYAVIAQQWDAPVAIRKRYSVSERSVVHMAYEVQRDPKTIVHEYKIRAAM